MHWQLKQLNRYQHILNELTLMFHTLILDAAPSELFSRVKLEHLGHAPADPLLLQALVAERASFVPIQAACTVLVASGRMMAQGLRSTSQVEGYGILLLDVELALHFWRDGFEVFCEGLACKLRKPLCCCKSTF